MTLKDMKQKTFSLIEEYYPEVTGLAEDEDVLNKINGVVNQIQMDLMKYRKINAKFTKEITTETSKEISVSDEVEKCYQIKNIILTPEGNYTMPDENTIILDDDYEGTIDIYYYKLPTEVELNPEEPAQGEDSYDDTYEFEIDPVLLEIMPYGIAADLLKMDMISNYGRYFREEYESRKNSIDTRRTSGMIYIDGGVDI